MKRGYLRIQGRIQDFKLGGAHLKKLRRAEGGAKIFGVFRVKKNHDFTPKNHIFSNCGGRHEHFWGISCEKSRFYAKKLYFFPILGGARARPPLNPPLFMFLILCCDVRNDFRIKLYWVRLYPQLFVRGSCFIYVCLPMAIVVPNTSWLLE